MRWQWFDVIVENSFVPSDVLGSSPPPAFCCKESLLEKVKVGLEKNEYLALTVDERWIPIILAASQISML